jgi:hypothetical protein
MPYTNIASPPIMAIAVSAVIIFFFYPFTLFFVPQYYIKNSMMADSHNIKNFFLNGTLEV